MLKFRINDKVSSMRIKGVTYHTDDVVELDKTYQRKDFLDEIRTDKPRLSKIIYCTHCQRPVGDKGFKNHYKRCIQVIA